MNLNEIVARTAITPAGRSLGDAAISGVSDDSRRVSAGDLFVCTPSARTDTHQFLDQVRSKGAAAALVHSAAGSQVASNLGLPWIHVEQALVNRFAGRAAHLVFGEPCLSMKVVAVTGTNGKTTTAWILRHALAKLEGRAGYVGTLGAHDGLNLTDTENTTPFPVETARWMANCQKAGCQALAIEASSHALHQDRLAGAFFDAGVFTNLTQDHLDYHQTMEAYGDAKLLLFTDLAEESRQAGKSFGSAINAGNPTGRAWLDRISGRIISFFDDQGLQVEPIELGAASSSLRLAWEGQSLVLTAPLGGQFNLENLTAAVAGLMAMGYRFAESVESLQGCPPAPGRFESVTNEQGIDVIVDYAHTPDALEKVLGSAQAIKRGRLITVFGCGGDRDKTKRPKMAAAAAAASDVVVVTSDNPRTEDPEEIIKDVLAGIPTAFTALSLVDREEAIQEAIQMARPGDLVLIAGKGNEDYQIIGHTKHPMDDRAMAKKALEARS